MEISALIFGYNEEENLQRLFKPLKVLKDIVFIDHQSTDNTAQLARDLGAKVITREFPYDLVTKDDLKWFKKRYGYDASFRVGDKIHKAGWEREYCGQFTQNDWILNLDCDEEITWDYKKVKKMLPHCDIINCKFFHDHNPDGTRLDWFEINKLYNRTKTWWIGRIHEVLDGNNLRVGWSEEMEIDHWHKPKEYRKGYIGHLEYAMLYEPNPRHLYYLGKENHQSGYWEKAIQFLTLYLKESVVNHEKVSAYLMIANSMWQLGREDEAWIYAFQAIKLNPNALAVYNFLASISKKSEKEIWLKHAELASNDHLL